jgi:hypothetical protein
LDVASYLTPETILHHPLVGYSYIFETEGHDLIAKNAIGCDKSCFFFIFSLQLDLVIAGIYVQKGKPCAPRY